MKKKKNQNDCGRVGNSLIVEVEVVEGNWFVFAFGLGTGDAAANLNLKS